MPRKYKGVKGVQLIHLFNEVWRIGRVKNKIGKESHLVIYDPKDKEHHAYGKDIKWMLHHDVTCDHMSTKRLNLGRVKAWILSNIIDDGCWEYELNNIPEVGQPIKVIYENGTIKNINKFLGKWDDHRMEIQTSVPMRLNPAWEKQHYDRVKSDNDKHESQYIWEPIIEYKNVLIWRNA